MIGEIKIRRIFKMQFGEVRPCRVRQGLTSNAGGEMQVKYKIRDTINTENYDIIGYGYKKIHGRGEN